MFSQKQFREEKNHSLFNRNSSYTLTTYQVVLWVIFTALAIFYIGRKFAETWLCIYFITLMLSVYWLNHYLFINLEGYLTAKDFNVTR